MCCKSDLPSGQPLIQASKVPLLLPLPYFGFGTAGASAFTFFGFGFAAGAVPSRSASAVAPHVSAAFFGFSFGFFLAASAVSVGFDATGATLLAFFLPCLGLKTLGWLRFFSGKRGLIQVKLLNYPYQ